MAVQVMDGLLSPSDVGTIVKVWHRYPFYDAIEQQPRARHDPGFAQAREQSRRQRTTVDESGGDLTAAGPLDLGGRFPGLDGRVDVDRNFIRTEGVSGSDARPSGLALTNYFRANYVYRDRVSVSAIEAFLNHANFVDVARQVFDHQVVVPSIVYANILLPGQQLPVHTDVPEFIGADRKRLPLWLLVVMHHSRLFEDRRIPVATVIAYVESCAGGDFTYYPEHASPGGVRISPESGAAVALDADSTFHRIQTVGDVGARPPRNEPRMRLARDGKRRWRLQRHRRDQVESMGSYGSGDLRFSLSWKAYCFPNESERRQWASSVEELSLGSVVDRLVAELVARNKISTLDHGLTDFELSRLLIDEFIPFPEPALPLAPPLAPDSTPPSGAVKTLPT